MFRSQQKAPSRPPRAWRWFKRLVLLALLAGVAWLLFSVGLDRVGRPQIAQEISAATGLPARIGYMDVALWPRPRVVATDLVLGEDDFQVSIPRLDMTAEWRGLLRKRVRIASVRLTRPLLALPADRAEADARLEELLANLSKGESDWRVDAGEARIDGGRVVLGASPRPYAVFDLRATGVTSARPAVELAAELPRLGSPAQLSLEAGLTREKDAYAYEGDVEVQGLDLSRVYDFQGQEPGPLDAQASFRGEGWDEVSAHATLMGGKPSEGGEATILEAFARSMEADLRWEEETLTVSGLDIVGTGFQLKGGGMRLPDGSVELYVDHLEMTAKGVNRVSGLLPERDVTVDAREEARLVMTGVIVRRSPEGRIAPASGVITFEGVDIHRQDGLPILDNASAEVVLLKEKAELRTLEARDVALTGTIETDFETGEVAFDLQGAAELSPGLVAFVSDTEAVRDLEGTVAFDRLQGVIGPEGGPPEDLAIEATLTDGLLGIATRRFTERFRDISAELVTLPGRVAVDLEAASDDLGPVAVAGAYAVDDASWAGVLSFNASALDVSRLVGEGGRKLATTMVQTYGDSTFDTIIRLANEDRAQSAVELRRRGIPTLHCELIFGKEGRPGALDECVVTGDQRLETLRALMPEEIDGAGLASTVITYHEDEERLSFTLDLTDAAVSYRTLLRKEPGMPAGVAISGSVEGMWDPETIRVSCVGESIHGEYEDDDVVFEDFTVRLEPLAALVPGVDTMSGQVSGVSTLDPIGFSLALEEAGFLLADGLAMGPITGKVRYGEAGWAAEKLRIAGPETGFVIDGVFQDGVAQASATGDKLNIDVMTRLIDAAERLTGPGPRGAITPGDAAAADPGDAGEGAEGEIPAPAEEVPETAVEGTLSVAMDQVLYRNTLFEKVRAELAFDDAGIHFNDVSASSHSGILTGKAHQSWPKPGEPSQLYVKAGLDGVDASILDELFMPEPRGLAGRLTGTVELAGPLPEQAPFVQGATGVIQFRGEDGTLGKMGLATKLLTVLRTTEIIQLRGLPTKDEGLTFDTLLATLPVQKGVMQVDPLALESPSFMLVAKGQVDFVKETLDVTSDLYLLESVTGILDQVPVLSEAVELFKEAVDVRLQISGNLDDPEVVPRLVDTATSVVGTVTGAAGGLVKGVTGEAQRTLEGLLGGGGDTADERKEAETDGAEQPPSEPTG